MSLFRMQTIYILAAIGLLPFLPFLYLQGLYVRRKIGTLPEARGDASGKYGAGESFAKLLVIGESTVAGVGARNHETALAGQFARFLSRKIGTGVRYTAVGKSGVTARRAIRELVPQIPDENFDYIVVGLGGNDVLKLSSPRRWRNDMKKLLRILRQRNPSAKIFITNVAAVNLSPALPHPIKGILSRLSRLHNANIIEFSRDWTDVFYYPQPQSVPADFFSDGIHPSEAGYAAWAEEMIKTLLK